MFAVSRTPRVMVMADRGLGGRHAAPRAVPPLVRGVLMIRPH
jgi:hypothetical protein